MVSVQDRKKWRAYMRWGVQLNKAAEKQYRDERVKRFKEKRKRDFGFL